MTYPTATAHDLERAARAHAAPPPDWTVAEHAERRRKLSKETSDLDGNYRLDVTPYWREPLEWYTREELEYMVILKITQIGYSEIMNNIKCYHIDLDPAPMITLFPTQDDARDWSTEKFTPMVRDTPCLHGKIMSRREKSGQNTTNLNIRFTGGMDTLAWSNSASRLSQKSRRLIFIEEPDRCSTDAKGEGKAINLVIRRGDSFANRKVVMGGSPTQKNFSAIYQWMETTDWREYWIPCWKCGGHQTIEWKMVSWDKAGGGDTAAYNHPKYGYNLPETAHLVCRLCEARITNDQKIDALADGKWVATRPFRGRAGFALQGPYSPMPKATLRHVVEEYLEAKAEADKGDYSDMRVWTNTRCGEWYEEPAEEEYSEESISHLREVMTGPVPHQVKYITAFIDPGGQWTDYEIVGWGDEDETWGLVYGRVHYGMESGKKDTALMFAELEHVLFSTPLEHATMGTIEIGAVGIDTGYHTEDTYGWIKAMRRKHHNRIYACKGEDGWESKSGWYRTSILKEKKILLRLIYVDQIKKVCMERMQIKDKGPARMHINANYPEEWEKQMTSNRLLTKWKNGQPLLYWKKNPWQRDEALDCRVGNMAVEKIAKTYFNQQAIKTQTPHQFAAPQRDGVSQPSPRSQSGFVKTGRPGGWMSR